jgi:hypothetical protein
LIEHGYDFSSRPQSSRPDVMDQLISEGKDVLNNIQKIEDLDLDSIVQTLQESDKAVQIFEESLKQQAEDLAKSPEFLLLQSSWLQQCEKDKKNCEAALFDLEKVDEKMKHFSNEVKKIEELEKALMTPVEVPSVVEQSLEDLDQEIESKLGSRLFEMKAEFSDLADITPENFPALYHVYEKVLQSLPESIE